MPSESSNDEKLLTKGEVAQLCRVAIRTVDRWLTLHNRFLGQDNLSHASSAATVNCHSIVIGGDDRTISYMKILAYYCRRAYHRATSYFASGARNVLATHERRRIVVSGTMVCVLASVALVSAQTGNTDNVPIPGVTGTIGIDATIDQFYATSHRALVAAADGVHHLVHLTGHTKVHGNKRSSEDELGELEPGTHVVVHYVETGGKKEALEIDRVGDDGLKVADGTVIDVDRAAKKLTIELPDHQWQTLRLTHRAAHDVGKDVRNGTRVVVYYADDSGEHIAHFFRRVE